MSNEQTVQTREELDSVLKRITFAPSCVDMQWEFDIVDGEVGGKSVWMVNTSFMRPDTYTKELARGKGRQEIVYPGTTVSGVVKTAFLLCKLIIEHELMEAMLFDGDRPFDPHNTIDKLTEASRSRLESEAVPA